MQHGKSGVRIVKLSKSGGVVTRPTQLRKVPLVVVVITPLQNIPSLRQSHVHPCRPCRLARLHMVGASRYQQEARTQRVREYFYGPHGELSPRVLRLKFSEVSIFRVGGGPRAPTSALPIGGSHPACWILSMP